MNHLKREKSIVDIIFIIAVFGVFTLSALFVVLFGARVYSRIASDMSTNFNKRTSLNYVSEKLHQHDFTGGVEIAIFEGEPTLKLNDEYADETYSTYLYSHDGYLKELTVRDDVSFNKDAGKNILKLNDFKADKISDSLYRFHMTDSNMNSTEFLVSVYSYTY